MSLAHRAVVPLKVFLVVLFAVLVVFQVLSFPGQFRYMAETQPERAHLQWPLTAIAVFGLLCVEVVVVATWKLLTLVRKDRIFTKASMVWVDAIVWAIAAAWVVLLGIFLWVGFNADDPGAPMMLFAMVVGLAVVGLVMVVMRALLQQATALRTDMEEVI
ncbi:DUF2975 domain-containing protein [Allokutzneria sp. NRRL B-24872]|uniref:DUF2975 domain-containing protein n=1 Tax=Allokutzneria sp. NRRL B-24872 TaxID=1137961 RepID=UPI000A385AE1|nr:DUF2975 domain-containing protein [Allokutzneria sp. NRRL B-24872]